LAQAALVELVLRWTDKERTDQMAALPHLVVSIFTAAMQDLEV
jgi:hypothetical protein